MSPDRIAIIGAGLGGLMAARMLQLHGLRATVYERDADASYVASCYASLTDSARVEQGGTLDMHADAGLLALKRAGLLDAFNSVARYEGDATRVFDKRAISRSVGADDPDGTLLLDEKGPLGPPDPRNPGRPEVDRSDLRRILLDSLDAGTVQWGRTLRHIDVPDSTIEPIRLRFDDGSTEEADLLIGADGAWSKVRPLLTDVKPEYSGYVYIELLMRDAPAEIAELVGAGSLFSCGDGRTIVSQRNAGTRIRTYAGMRAPLKWDDAPRTADEVAALYQGWAPKLLSLVTASTEAPTIRQLWRLPNGHAWSHRPRITLLGDAAHLVRRFRQLA